MRRGSAGQHGGGGFGGYNNNNNNDGHRSSQFGRSGTSPVQFSLSRFRHNDRVALALLPALAVVAGSADATVLWVLLAGAAITYMLDAAGARQATLLAAWATLAGANAGLLLTGAPTERGARPLFLTVLAAAFNAATLLATGCWATLQFRWVQRQHPAAVLSLERGLLAAAVPLGAAAAGLVCLTALSPAAAPFGTSAALLVLYFALCVPLRSSFVVEISKDEGGGGAVGGKAGEGKGGAFPSSSSSLAVTRASALRGALLLLSLPALQYLSMHRGLLLAHRDVHGWALLLLVSFPLAVMAAARRGLWFLESFAAAKKQKSPAAARAAARRAHRRLRRALLLLSCAGTVAGLEGRVLLRAARQYLVLPSPWAGIALGVALAPLAAFGAMHASGLLEDDFDDDEGEGDGGVSASFADSVFGSSSSSNRSFSSSSSPKSATAAGPALVLAACALSAAAGVPLWALPAPLSAAAGLALFWDTRRTRHSLLFAAGALASAAWFAWHHFGHLSLPDNGNGGGGNSASSSPPSLSSLAFASVVVAAPAAVLPGLASKAAATSAAAGASAAVAAAGAGLALLLHACGVAALEQALYCGDHSESGSGSSPSWVSSSSEMYPAYLVVATSVALSAAARALSSRCSGSGGGGSSSSSSSSVVAFFAAATKWLCLAKLSILVLPSSRPLWPAALWLMSAGPGVAAAFFRGGGGSSGGGGEDDFENDDDDERKKENRNHDGTLSSPPRLSKTAAVSLALLGALATFRARFLVFEALEAGTGVRPTHATAAGALAAALGAATAPALHAGGVAGIPLALASAVGAAGLAVLALEPPLPASALGEDCSLGVLCPAALLRWDQQHTPESAAAFSSGSSSDDVAVWGDLGLSGREGGRYPSWLLVSAAAAGAAAAAVGGFGNKSRRKRGGRNDNGGIVSAVGGFFSGVSSVSLAATAAAAVGAFVAGEAFPSPPSPPSSIGGRIFSFFSFFLPGLAGRAALHLSVLGSAVALSLCTLLARSRSRSAGAALRGALLPWLGALGSAAAALWSSPASKIAAAAAAAARAAADESGGSSSWLQQQQQPLRLFPDALSAAARDADAAERSTLAGIAAAEFFLLALACKLRVSLEVRRERETVVVGVGGGGGDGEGGIGGIGSQGGDRHRSPGASAAAACARGANMGFLPLLSNALALGGYALAVLAGFLAAEAASQGSGGGGEGAAGAELGDLAAAARAAAALAPALLLLGPDPRVFRGLSPDSNRRHAPPALAAALSLATATLLSLARDAAVRRRMVAGFPGATFGGGEEGGGGGGGGGFFASLFSSASGGGPGGGSGLLGDALRETGLVLAALPAHALLFAHLWRWGGGAAAGGGGGGAARPSSSAASTLLLVVAAPLSALSLAAARCPSTKWLAAGSLAALAVVGAQRGLSSGRRRRLGRPL